MGKGNSFLVIGSSDIKQKTDIFLLFSFVVEEKREAFEVIDSVAVLFTRLDSK